MPDRNFGPLVPEQPPTDFGEMIMKKILLPLVLFVTALSVLANDGSFYSSGNTLIPLQETRIGLKKEVLRFYVRDFSYMDVEVDFEFFNPDRARRLTVGFVTPPAIGDVSQEEESHPQITGFTVEVNGRTIPFQIKRMKDTSFKLGDSEVRGDDFVYYFPADFKKGSNRIRHTYRFRGGTSVEMQRDFNYQITTGKRWANSQIDDFRLEVHLDNGIYFIPASFVKSGKAAPWQIEGDGVIDQNQSFWFDEESPKIRMAHLNRGYLLLEEKNFRPDNDFFVGEYNWPAGWASRWCRGDEDECIEPEMAEKILPYFDLKPWDGVDQNDLAELSETELKLVRNFFYAVRGLDFKDAELRKFYSRFFWYKPDKTLKAEEVRFSDAEKIFLDKVREAEKKK